LAVESAAVFLGEFAEDVSCEAFLIRLRKEGFAGFEAASWQGNEGVRHGNKGLEATLSPTLVRMGERELCVLNYASYLSADRIPIGWLRGLAAELFPEFDRDAEPGYPDPWKSLLRRLFGLRFLRTISPDGQGQPEMVSMHRLVQELIRQRQADSTSVKANLNRYLDAYLLSALSRPWLSSETHFEMIQQILQLVDPFNDRLAAAKRTGKEAVRQVARDPALSNLHNVYRATAVNLFLAYRDVADYSAVIELFDRLPESVQRLRVPREQFAFSLNRIGRSETAKVVLENILSDIGGSSETYCLLGRVCKDQWERAKQEGWLNADNLLQQAIDAYSAGFNADRDDPFPGVCAVMLMELQKVPHPRQADLLSLARYAALQRARKGGDYWDHATLLELAVLARNIDEATSAAAAALAVVRAPWEPETTLRNLRLIRQTRQERGEDVGWVSEIEHELEQAAAAFKGASEAAKG
jgi:hypothetical protein